MNPSIPSLFVSPSPVLRAGGRAGGVQICTREYIDTLDAAGFSLKTVGYDPDRRLVTRIRKRIWPRPYRDTLPPGLEDQVVSHASDGVRYVFLNLVDLAPLACRLKERLGPGCRIVLLSHGLESVDYLHFLRARGLGQPFGQATAGELKALARKLVAECTHRLHIDHVFCLAPFEAEIERWLGARRVDWLPRTVPDRRLEWAPVPGRLGFVGTLDHPPNAEGLALFLRSLGPAAAARPGVKVRVVGGPRKEAESLTSGYPFAEYLGPLSDDEMEKEAATWNCFVHPLFCYARGCSTKLAVALSWRIPVVTTPSGCRGYEWRKGRLPLGETPEEVARLALTMLDGDAARGAREEVEAVVASSPTRDEVAARIRAALLGPSEAGDR